MEFISSDNINLNQLRSLIDLHEITEAPSVNTLVLINKAISLSKFEKNDALEKDYTIRKFKLCCADGNYKLASKLWEEITTWSIIPDQYNSNSLLFSYLKTVETKATSLKLLKEIKKMLSKY